MSARAATIVSDRRRSYVFFGFEDRRRFVDDRRRSSTFRRLVVDDRKESDIIFNKKNFEKPCPIVDARRRLCPSTT